MHHLYHTDAIVLATTPHAEGSRVVFLYTRELGFLSATAQSVREERSKLRYGLQEFSHSLVTLVRGKERWRITGAEPYAMWSEGECSRAGLLTTGRVCALLRRLLAGEEKNEPLFDAVAEGLRTIQRCTDAKNLEGIEIVLVLRILYFLGYLAPRAEFDPFLTHVGMWDDDTLSRALLCRSVAVSEINHSLRQSQL